MNDPTVRLLTLAADNAEGTSYTLTIAVDGEQHTIAFQVDGDGADAEPDATLNAYLDLLDEHIDELSDEEQRRYVTAHLIHEIIDRVGEAGLIFPLTLDDLGGDDDDDDDLDDDDLDGDDLDDDDLDGDDLDGDDDETKH